MIFCFFLNSKHYFGTLKHLLFAYAFNIAGYEGKIFRIYKYEHEFKKIFKITQKK